MTTYKILRLLLILLLMTFIIGNILRPVEAQAGESVTTFLITGEFNDTLLEKAANELGSLPDNSKIQIIIDSPGGLVYVEQFIVNLIKMKNLSTTCLVPAYAASAAAMTALSCDVLDTPDTSIFVFHMKFKIDALGNKVRTSQMILEEILADGPVMKKIMTEKQYQEWLNGGDIFISGKQLKEKLNNVLH